MFHYYHSGCRRQNVKLAIGNAHICDNVIHVPNIYMNEWMNECEAQYLPKWMKSNAKQKKRIKTKSCHAVYVEFNWTHNELFHAHAGTHTHTRSERGTIALLLWYNEILNVHTHTHTHWRSQYFRIACDDDDDDSGEMELLMMMSVSMMINARDCYKDFFYFVYRYQLC